MEGMVIMLGNFNTQSPKWNVYCNETRHAAGLEALVERYYLILNNKLERATRPKQRNTTSIINLTFNNPEIGALNDWIINEELSTPSDHEVIVHDLANLNETVGGMRTSQDVMELSIKSLSGKNKKETSSDWHQEAAWRSRMGEESSREDSEREVQWIVSTLTETLDKQESPQALRNSGPQR